MLSTQSGRLGPPPTAADDSAMTASGQHHTSTPPGAAFTIRRMGSTASTSPPRIRLWLSPSRSLIGNRPVGHTGAPGPHGGPLQ